MYYQGIPFTFKRDNFMKNQVGLRSFSWLSILASLWRVWGTLSVQLDFRKIIPLILQHVPDSLSYKLILYDATNGNVMKYGKATVRLMHNFHHLNTKSMIALQLYIPAYINIYITYIYFILIYIQSCYRDFPWRPWRQNSYRMQVEQSATERQQLKQNIIYILIIFCFDT